MKLFALIFGGVGLLLGAIGAAIHVRQARWEEGAVRADGVVVALRTSSKGMAKPVVRFAAGGGREVEFEGGVASKPPSYEAGEAVRVLYRPEDPEDARIDSFVERRLVSAILFGMGGVFGSIGAGFAVVPWLGRRRRERARRFGIPVRAKVTEIARDLSVRVSGRSPWVVRAEFHDAPLQKTFRFESEHLWSDPNERLRPGDEVTVYYLPDEPRVYALDLGDGPA